MLEASEFISDIDLISTGSLAGTNVVDYVCDKTNHINTEYLKTLKIGLILPIQWLEICQ